VTVAALKINRTRTEPGSHGSQDVPEVVPVSIISDWIDCCLTPETADNSGSTITNPAGVTDFLARLLSNVGRGTTAQIRLKYDDGITGETSPVVQPFGLDGNGSPQRLVNASGTHELTLTMDLTNDVTDGTYKFTQPVEVDMDGNRDILVAIKTAFNGTGTKNNATIQVRVK
jgi:hypothetical protein